MTDETKRCARCDLVKPLDDFTPKKRGTGGVQTYCRSCFAEYRRERRRVGLDKNDYPHSRALRSEALSILCKRHADEYAEILRSLRGAS